MNSGVEKATDNPKEKNIEARYRLIESIVTSENDLDLLAMLQDYINQSKHPEQAIVAGSEDHVHEVDQNPCDSEPPVPQPKEMNIPKKSTRLLIPTVAAQVVDRLRPNVPAVKRDINKQAPNAGGARTPIDVEEKDVSLFTEVSPGGTTLTVEIKEKVVCKKASRGSFFATKKNENDVPGSEAPVSVPQ